MRVKVLFFGATADAVGEREIVVDVSDETTVNQAVAKVVSEYSQLSTHKLLFALNEEYVDGDKSVSHDDELAIFTAVSGG